MLASACAVLSPARTLAAERNLPEVDVVLVAEIEDTVGWLALHQEVLATPPSSARILRATLPARTGGSRTIDVEQARFAVTLVPTGGSPQVKVTVAGKIPPALALTVVVPFQEAALEVQSGGMANELWLTYGLSSVVGRLVELDFNRP